MGDLRALNCDPIYICYVIMFDYELTWLHILQCVVVYLMSAMQTEGQPARQKEETDRHGVTLSNVYACASVVGGGVKYKELLNLNEL